MARHVQLQLEGQGLQIRAVPYRYVYCPRCRSEWPSKHKSCPECIHWLGEQPLERTEWQLAPATKCSSEPKRYELVSASALILRFASEHPPFERQIADAGNLVRELFSEIDRGVINAVAEHGWLVWSSEGLRHAFGLACELERRLVASLTLRKHTLHGAKVRWGLYTDQYVLPLDQAGCLVISDSTAHGIFHFEPDSISFASEAIYRVNRRWEHFVCAPRRLLNDEGDFAYRMIARKRPSALDHAEVENAGPFVGRERQLGTVDQCYKHVGRSRTLAIVAEAGSGKTRLIREWLARHPKTHAITANFSLFGGDIESFASQLAELPSDRPNSDALVQVVMERIQRDRIEVLVLDDIHWAGTDGQAFLHRMLAALASTQAFVILASRPSGQDLIRSLRSDIELKLQPLSQSTATELACRLSNASEVATVAAARSKGSPLFVEQFVCWASETKFQGGESGPRNLHQVVAARIRHLADVRIKDIRQQLRWGRSWERKVVHEELGRLEVEIGLWLDRLETGDCADRVETTRHLGQLERLDYEIFITSTLAGRPRPRSSRLREAIERLLIGSADQILADLRSRAARGDVGLSLTVRRPLYIFQWLSCCVNLRRCH
jgi:AAA ATPase domain